MENARARSGESASKGDQRIFNGQIGEGAQPAPAKADGDDEGVLAEWRNGCVRQKWDKCAYQVLRSLKIYSPQHILQASVYLRLMGVFDAYPCIF